MIVAIKCHIDNSTEHIDYGEHSIRLFKDYFAHHGIEYHFITECPKEVIEAGVHPSWTKLFAHRILPGYDYIIIWDLDLLPRTRDVKVIQEFNMEKLSIVWDTNARGHSIATDGKGYLYFPSFKYNTGLIGVPQSYQPFLDSIRVFMHPIVSSYEQYPLNDEIVKQNISIHELPDDLNTLYVSGNFSTARLQHYTCGDNPKSKIEEHVNRYFSQD
jgi:hypothetical protein